MTEPTGQPGTGIQAGDKVTHSETGGTGHVEGVLPVYAGFMGGEQAVLFVLAAVRWRGQKKLALERAADLDQLTDD